MGKRDPRRGRRDADEVQVVVRRLHEAAAVAKRTGVSQSVSFPGVRAAILARAQNVVLENLDIAGWLERWFEEDGCVRITTKSTKVGERAEGSRD